MIKFAFINVTERRFANFPLSAMIVPPFAYPRAKMKDEKVKLKLRIQSPLRRSSQLMLSQEILKLASTAKFFWLRIS